MKKQLLTNHDPDRQPVDPTPEQIRQRAAEVQRTWTPREHEKHGGDRYRVPVAALRPVKVVLDGNARPQAST